MSQAAAYRVQAKNRTYSCDTLEQAQETMARSGGDIWQLLDGQWRPWPLIATVMPEVQKVPAGAEDQNRTFDGYPRCKAASKDGKRCERSARMNSDYCASHTPEAAPQTNGSYSGRHPGMRSARWEGVAEKLAALQGDQTAFVATRPGELVSMLANRLRSAAASWNLTRNMRFSIRVADGGVEVSRLQPRSHKKFRSESETDSQPKSEKPEVSMAEQFRRPGESQDHSCAGSVVGDEVCSPRPTPGTGHAQAEGQKRVEVTEGPSRNRTLESGEAGAVNVGGEVLKSPMNGGPVGDVTAGRDPRPRTVEDEFLDLALYFHGSDPKPASNKQMLDAAQRLTVLADGIRSVRRAEEIAKRAIEEWAAKWSVKGSAAAELQTELAKVVRSVLPPA